MNITDQYIILAAALGLLAGCAIGFWSGNKSGHISGWERCRWEIGMRQAAKDSARRDPATGRYRKVQR